MNRGRTALSRLVYSSRMNFAYELIYGKSRSSDGRLSRCVDSSARSRSIFGEMCSRDRRPLRGFCRADTTRRSRAFSNARVTPLVLRAFGRHSVSEASRSIEGRSLRSCQDGLRGIIPAIKRSAFAMTVVGPLLGVFTSAENATKVGSVG